MYDSDSKGISNGAGLLILFGLWIAGFIAAAILSLVVTLALGGNLADIMGNMDDPKNVTVLRLIQVVSTAAVFFLPAVVVATIMNRKPMRFLGLNKQLDTRQLLLALAIMFFAAVLAGALAQIMELIPLSANAKAVMQDLEDKYAKQVEAIAGMKNFGEYLVALFMIALLPGLFEETFFRGGMQNLLTRASHNPWFAIVITSIIFSVVHVSYYGFLSRVCLGIVLGLIYYYTQNLWLSIIAHMFNNAFAITQMYIVTRQGKSVHDAMNEKMDWWWGVIALAAVYGLFILFKKVTREVNARHGKETAPWGQESFHQNQF